MNKKKISRILGVGLTLALLSSLLVGALPVSASAVTSATVTLASPNYPLDKNAISRYNEYTITFDVDQAVALAGTVTIQFPVGTLLPAELTHPQGAWAAGDVTLQATAGFGLAITPARIIGAARLATTAGSALAGPKLVITLDVLDVPNGIGEGATVRIKVLGAHSGPPTYPVVRNAPGLGDQVLKISTTADTTPTSSQPFTLIVPTIPGVPGIVQGLNSSGIKIYEATGANAINIGIGTAGVVKVVVGPGTYDEDVIITAGKEVVSSSGAAVTIITNADLLGGGGTVTITSTGLTAKAKLDGLTVTGGVTAIGPYTTITNCILSNGAGPALVTGAGTGATTPVASTGNTYTVPRTSISAGLQGLFVQATHFATSTGDTFNVGRTATYVNGMGIDNDGTVTVTGSTFAGSSGVGVRCGNLAVAASTTITGSSFSNLSQAATIVDGTVRLTTSTIDACGVASATTPMAAIKVTALNAGPPQNQVRVYGNTITNGPENILEVAANANFVFANFNTLTGNVKSFDNNDIANPLDARNNWWGSAAGPAVASEALNPVTAPVRVSPWLNAAPVTPTVSVAAATLAGQTTVGVNVAVNTNAAPPVASPAAIIGAANYASNPVTAAPPADTKKFYDVFVAGPQFASDVATLTFFGITTNAARIWAYSKTQALWVQCSSQVVDLFQGAVVVTISAGTSPNLGNLTALEFVLTEPGITPLVASAQNSLVPAIATEDVDISLVAFSWGAVAGATGYEFQLAEYLAGGENPFIPAFLLLEENPDTNGVVLLTDLDYLTVYSWRVRGLRGTEEGPWVSAFFTTAAEVPEDVQDTWIIEQEPTQIEWPDDITIVVPPIEQQEIPEYILWVIVAVGAILVIAVVVLIVRTRRVA